MKLSQSWILALLACSTVSFADQQRFLQSGTETTAAEGTTAEATAETTTDTGTGTAEGTGEEKKEGEEEKKEGEEEKKEEKVEAVVDPAKKFDPENQEYDADDNPTKPWLNIFSQGTVNWYGGEIYTSFPEPTENNTEEVNNIKRMIRDEQVQPIVGFLDGQTGWTGVNQDGIKLMSYQIAIVIKAKEGKTLQDIFPVNLPDDKSSTLGWWIPDRDATDPPEKWTMILADINLKTNVFDTTIKMTQSKHDKQLFNPAGSIYSDDTEEQYKLGGEEGDEEFNKKEYDNISLWTFDANGKLNTSNDTAESSKTKDDYFVPIKTKTSISQDKLIIAIEGTGQKPQLPEIRGGKSVPFYFQIIDYEGRTILRQKFDKVPLKFSKEYNRCTKPEECPDDSEADGASMLATFAASSVVALASILAF